MQIQPQINQTEKAVKDWTVLLYMDGNNEIEGDVLRCFLTAEEVSDVNKMNIIAQLARAPQSIANNGCVDKIDGDWSGTRRYNLAPGVKEKDSNTCYTNIGNHNEKIDSPVISDLKDVDMSKPETLKEFLNWAMVEYPAKNFMLVLSDHGFGFLGAMTDYKSKNMMKLPEMEGALKDTLRETGQKLDVLVFDACLMSQIEVYNQFKNVADYIVSSESMIYSCFPFQKILTVAKQKLENEGALKPGDFAKVIVKESENNIRDIPAMAAVKSSKINVITEKIKALSAALLKTDISPEVIRNIFSQTQYGSPDSGGYKPYEDYRDLKNFAYLLSKSAEVKDDDIKNAAGELYCLINMNIAVIAEYHDKSFYKYNDGPQNTGGISIYLPPDCYEDNNHSYPYFVNPKDIKPVYKELKFAKETGWDRVLEKFFSNPS